MAVGTSSSFSRLEGWLEAVQDGVVRGWVRDPTAPTARLKVLVRVDGAAVAEGVADVLRPRLRDQHGIGDGAHVFQVVLPDALADGRQHHVAVAVADEPASVLPAAIGFEGRTTDPASRWAATRFVTETADDDDSGPDSPAERGALEVLVRPTVVVDAAGDDHRVVLGEGTRLERVEVHVDGDDFELVLGDGVTLRQTTIHVKGDGCRVIVGAGARLRGATLRVQGTQGVVDIGERTTMEGGSLLVHEGGQRITIGQDCMLSRDLFLRTSDSHPIYDLATGERINGPASIEVRDHVWIGAGAKIGKGIVVGSGAVVGQYSVVTADVPENCVVAGIPARVVREGIRWERDFS